VSVRTSRLLALGVVLVAPLFGVIVLRAPLMNHLAYRDPWFYSGYGWTLAHHIEVFGWFYYAVRFPVTLPIRWTTDLFGPVAGYVVLRYAVLVGTGAALYACVRRFASVTVACASVVLLAINPFYMRMVLWDYTSYIALPCAIVAVAVWLMASTRGATFWAFLGSGALLGASVFANPLSATVVPALAFVEIAAVLRGGARELARLAARSAAAALGAAVVFVGGYLGYYAYLGSFDPYELLEPTIEFIRATDQRSAPFQLPLTEFLEGEPRIYAPLLLSLGLAVALGRAVGERGIRGRLAQFALAYVAVVWIYRLTITSAVVETWWAYNMVAISMCFAAPLILDELERAMGRRSFYVTITVAIASAAIATFVIRTRNSWAVSVYEHVRDNFPVLIALLALGVASAGLLRFSGNTAVRAAVAGAFFALVAFVSLTPARYAGTRQTGEFAEDGRAELRGYRAAFDMAKLIEDVDQPDRRTLLWTTLVGSPVVSWTNLPHQGGSINNPEAPLQSLSSIAPGQDGLLRYPTTARVLLLSQDPADMDRGVRALRRLRMHPTLLRRGSWGDGYLQYALVALPRQ
jgi:hypothetical protein